MAELKICPFCGEKPIRIHNKRYPWWTVDQMKPVDVWTICCANDRCIITKALNMYYRSEEEAENAWNRRIGDDHEIQTVQGNGKANLRAWQYEIMDRDRDLQRGTGRGEGRDGQE